jgi:hypothetical protein
LAISEGVMGLVVTGPSPSTDIDLKKLTVACELLAVAQMPRRRLVPICAFSTDFTSGLMNAKCIVVDKTPATGTKMQRGFYQRYAKYRRDRTTRVGHRPVRDKVVGILKNGGEIVRNFDQRDILVKMIHKFFAVDSALTVHANQTAEERVDGYAQTGKVVRRVMNNRVFIRDGSVLRAID